MLKLYGVESKKIMRGIKSGVYLDIEYSHIADIVIAPTTINTEFTRSVHITAESPPAIVNTDVIARSIIIEMYKVAV